MCNLCPCFGKKMFSLRAKLGVEDCRHRATNSASSVCQNGKRNLLQQKIQLNSTWPFIQSSGIHKLYVLLQNSCRWSKVMIKYCCCLPRSSMFGLWLQRVIRRTKPTPGLFRVLFQLSWEGIRGIIWILIKGRFHHHEWSLQTANFLMEC